MQVTDLGFWQNYSPEDPPYTLPVSALWLKRESDGVDWYVWRNSRNWNSDTIKAVVETDKVVVSDYDATKLFPSGARLIEVRTGTPGAEASSIVGFIFSDGVLTPPPTDPAPEIVVTPRQIRLAINQIGMRAQVEVYVATADQDTKDSWLYSSQFERSHPMIAAAAASVGKTDEDIDALFALATTL